MDCAGLEGPVGIIDGHSCRLYSLELWRVLSWGLQWGVLRAEEAPSPAEAGDVTQEHSEEGER